MGKNVVGGTVKREWGLSREGSISRGVRAGGELSGECLVIINGYTINSASYDKN